MNSHESSNLLIEPPSAPTPPPPEVNEDAGSQALSEALRSSFAIVKALMIGLVIVFFASGFFTINQQERGIVLRFGKPVGAGEKALLGPGAHWALPSPIDEVVRIPIGQVQTVAATIGWYATTSAREASGTEPEPGPSLNPAVDGYLLTGDGNIIHARGTLLYRISEPGLRFAFDFVEASNLVQNAFNSALLYAAAGMTVDEALKDIAAFREKTAVRLQELLIQQQLGVVVDRIDLQPIPPRKLRPDFEKVTAALVTRDKLMNEARSYENQTLTRAQTEAGVRVNAGITESNLTVQVVAADAQRFTELLPAYHRNPELFMRQRQLDTLSRVLTNAENKTVLPRNRDGKPIELRLQLSREAPKQKTYEPPGVEEKH
jgi:membrane protease subunit HflK